MFDDRQLEALGKAGLKMTISSEGKSVSGFLGPRYAPISRFDYRLCSVSIQCVLINNFRFTCDFFDVILSPMQDENNNNNRNGDDEDEDEMDFASPDTTARGLAWIMADTRGNIQYHVR